MMMMMISHFVPLLGSFISSDLFQVFFYPLFCVYFIACVPVLFTSLTQWR